MKTWLVRRAYALLLWLALPAYLWRLWRRGAAEPAYRLRWAERLGLAAGDGVRGRVWIHAVSLGETRAAAVLIDALRTKRPGLRILLTHHTATGRAAGAALLQPGDAQAWLPYDLPGAVRRFLRRQRPALGVLMETEVWPNLMQAAQRAGVPMLLANARLSPRSLERQQKLPSLLRPAMRNLARTLAQTGGDARRLHEAGAREIKVPGNLKFDITPPPRLLARGLQWRQQIARPVVLAASTRDGEEAPLLDAWRGLPAPRPLLVLVPRHPQRFDAVAELVRRDGLQLVRRSSWSDGPSAEDAYRDVWLGDSMGEMPLYYGLADAALLGGSFAPLGGQNLIEAAACGCPLVMGPHTFNFALAAELALAAHAAIRCAGITEGVQQAVNLALDPARNDWVQRALGFAAQHRGAAERTADEVLALLRAPR